MSAPEENPVCASCHKPFRYGDSDLLRINELIELTADRNDPVLCYSCRINDLRKTIRQYVEVLTHEKIKKVQRLGRPAFLEEGIDYEVNKAGFWVFTKWYLLRKGDCCRNGCRNCPY